MNARRPTCGFTLIELMVVVIIIAALAGMVLPHVLPASQEAKQHIAKGGISSIELGLKLYYLHNDRFPTTEEGLKALISSPASARNWHGPYLDKARVPLDPWKREYQYRSPGTRNKLGFDLWSLGALEESSDDDINNWDE